eukprot:6181238-Pleurochrysis_carterae.AAC.1
MVAALRWARAAVAIPRRRSRPGEGGRCGGHLRAVRAGVGRTQVHHHRCGRARAPPSGRVEGSTMHARGGGPQGNGARAGRARCTARACIGSVPGGDEPRDSRGAPARAQR